MKLTVPDMSCNHCVATMTRAVHALDPKAKITADLAAKTVAVDTSVADDHIRQALEEAGYPNSPAS